MNKIQIVVVDDDMAARSTIKRHLQQHPLYEVAADFQDGRAALAWIRQNEVDLLLCDMQMPTMDGLELLRMVRVSAPDIAVIAVSSFDDFRYTRGCMVEGAADYLLKHELTQQRLLSVLDTVRDRYHIQPEGRTPKNVTGYGFERPEQFTVETVARMADQGEIAFEKAGLSPLVISPDYRCAPGANCREIRQDMCKAVCDMAAQILGSEYHYVYCITSRQHILLLLSFFHENSRLYIMNSVNNFCSRLKRTALRMLDLTLTIGVGAPQLPLDTAMEQIRSLDESMEAKLYLGGDRVFLIEAAPVLQERETRVPQPLLTALSFAIEQRDCLNAQAAVQEIFSHLRRAQARWQTVRYAVREIVDRLCRGGILDPDAREDLERRLVQFEILEQMSADLKEQLFQLMRSAPAEAPAAVSAGVARTREYVLQNYMRDISLQDCADYAGISYTYLSRAFKNETGQRFVEFLNEVRLRAAKTLLIRQEVSMKEIVERTGFRSYNYFFKVFRESEGMTPTEFVAKNCSKN